MKTPMDLLDLEFVFTQQELLRLDEFRRECDRRGMSLFSLDEGQLEPLHRAGVLVPIFRVQKDLRTARTIARRNGYPVSVVLSAVSKGYEDLRAKRDAGRLHDPRAEPFQSWSNYQRMIDGFRERTSDFLYSPYQMLLVPELRKLVPRMRISRSASGRFRFHLKLNENRRSEVEAQAKDNDELVVALSALDRVYRPRVIGRLSYFESWVQFEASFSPVEMLRWLEWDPQHVLDVADRLLDMAYKIDPLRDWIELVRLCRPDKWDKLRGDALVAMDHRMAAEMILLFYEDLVGVGAAPPLEPIPRYAWHPRCDRLGTNRDELDEVLMDYGLSPHPSLVMLLEGPTEMKIIPRVMKLLGISMQRSFIELHLANLDVSQLVAHIAPPSLGEALEEYINLARPPTHFLVVHDTENQFKNPTGVETIRQAWIIKIATAMQENYGFKILPDELQWLVEIETWGEENIEFAHFENGEIARAIDNTCRRLGITPDRMLTEEEVEQRRRSTHSQNIENLWKYGPFDREAKKKLKKLEVWEELWQILEQKIKAAIEHGNIETIPIARVLIRAYNIAIKVHRHSVVVSHVQPSSGEVKQP